MEVNNQPDPREDGFREGLEKKGFSQRFEIELRVLTTTSSEAINLVEDLKEFALERGFPAIGMVNPVLVREMDESEEGGKTCG